MQGESGNLTPEQLMFKAEQRGAKGGGAGVSQTGGARQTNLPNQLDSMLAKVRQIQPRKTQLSLKFKALGKLSADDFAKLLKAIPPQITDLELGNLKATQVNQLGGSLPPTLQRLALPYMDLSEFDSAQHSNIFMDLPDSLQTLDISDSYIRPHHHLAGPDRKLKMPAIEAEIRTIFSRLPINLQRLVWLSRAASDDNELVHKALAGISRHRLTELHIDGLWFAKPQHTTGHAAAATSHAEDDAEELEQRDHPGVAYFGQVIPETVHKLVLGMSVTTDPDSIADLDKIPAHISELDLSMTNLSGHTSQKWAKELHKLPTTVKTVKLHFSNLQHCTYDAVAVLLAVPGTVTELQLDGLQEEELRHKQQLKDALHPNLTTCNLFDTPATAPTPATASGARAQLQAEQQYRTQILEQLDAYKEHLEAHRTEYFYSDTLRTKKIDQIDLAKRTIKAYQPVSDVISSLENSCIVEHSFWGSCASNSTQGTKLIQALSALQPPETQRATPR